MLGQDPEAGPLHRLLRPRSIAVVGGGDWCRSVLEQCRKIGFKGALWAVHPTKDEVAGIPAYRDPGALPGVPDAVFVGVNRRASIDVIARLSAMGAGGAVCFASGFLETGEGDLTRALLEAAGSMPILGPNCYGVLNYLDRVALWPDQHGGQPVESGVAILTQSSNIALNLTMQRRGLPIAFVVTAGNQSQQGIAEIAQELLRDPRVTAVGLHIEGSGDLRALEALATLAADLKKRVVVLKVGASGAAQAAAVSHTASITGSEAGAEALIQRLGFLRARSLQVFLETLKLLHVHGPLGGRAIASLSCSGGEAALVADAAAAHGLCFPALDAETRQMLGAELGPLVSLANPLDYHTFIWRDRPAMAAVFAALTGAHINLTAIVLDFPRADRCSPADWQVTIDAVADAARLTGAPFAVLASLPECMPEEVAAALFQIGIAPLCGIDEAVQAIALAAKSAAPAKAPLLLPGAGAGCTPGDTRQLSEAEAKTALAGQGVPCPRMETAKAPKGAAKAAARIGFPVALKGAGSAHKTEAGAVVLGLRTADDVARAASAMAADGFLVEEMIGDAVAEVLIGATRDPAHGWLLTLAAGGVLAEILRDRACLLLPASRDEIRQALEGLAIWAILKGYRGAAAGNTDALLDTVMAVQEYVIQHHAGLSELELNPVIVTPTRAVAVDALIITKGN